MEAVKKEDKVYDVCAVLEREARKRKTFAAWLKLRKTEKTDNVDKSKVK